MPKPTHAGQSYLPGLDGLRALAVLAVIAFHEQFGWAQGGLLGVAVFFTLSGYLITGLLLSQWTADGHLHLRDFWLRRARRLLPALFVMLVLVTAWVTIADRVRLAGLRAAVTAAASYSSNWYLIAANQSYFARFAPPAPLDHLWSLAVEEQFYLLWPGLLLLGLILLRKWSGTGSVRWLALPTLLLAALSAVEMWWLYQPGYDPTRIYEGTDTRACGLLIGAALALACPASALVRPAKRARLLLDAAGAAGLVVIFLMIWRVGEYSPFAYRGGLVLLSVATAAVVAAAACVSSRVARGLGVRPLRWIGARSYGIYLWHYPVIVLTTPANTVADLPRASWQIAASIGLAALSWRFVEEPVRHGALSRLWRRADGWRADGLRVRAWSPSAWFPGGWPRLSWRALSWPRISWRALSWPRLSWRALSWPRISWRALSLRALSSRPVSWRGIARHALSWRAISWRAIGARAFSWHVIPRRIEPARIGGLAAIAAGSGALVVACGGLAGAFPAPAASQEGASLAGPLAPPPSVSISRVGSRTSAAASRAVRPRPRAGLLPSRAGMHLISAGLQPSRAGLPSYSSGGWSAGPLRTSCPSVVHIGDSTSDGLDSPDYLPDPRQRITARYEDVGVRTVYTNIVGARSVVETLPGTINAYDAALHYTRQGYHGCWVLALGTDDTADVAAGSQVSLPARIQRMMSAVHGQPVLWVNVKSLVASGPYAEADMQKWNGDLLRACARYPNMRIFDWAAVARPSWFIPDGIHYTSTGYQHRAKLIADALARAFPMDGQSSGCVIS